MSYHAVAAHPNYIVPGGVIRTGKPLDPLSLQFVIWAQAANGRALDIDCGDGTTTLALLARGGHVVAVDADTAALHRLVERVPDGQSRRLQVRHGQLPNIDFKVANFAAVHAARVLHLLDGASRQESIGKFYRWLYPRGRLFVSVAIRLLDEETLTRELEVAGFVIAASKTYVAPDSDTQECCAVIAHCAA
jgi:ubiquinone/menaquinone biosynthesis C-methylase UbiE